MRLWLLLLAAAAHGADITYWIQPCDRAGAAGEATCEAADEELARWALADWTRAGAGRIQLREVKQREQARIRVIWAGALQGLYGEMRPVPWNDGFAAEVYVRPDVRSFGDEIRIAAEKDPLFRHAIVYLTCLHETGHAFGLRHTRDFQDIMYSFQFGGDIREYFMRYRRKLSARDSIAGVTGVASGDSKQLAAILK